MRTLGGWVLALALATAWGCGTLDEDLATHAQASLSTDVDEAIDELWDDFEWPEDEDSAIDDALEEILGEQPDPEDEAYWDWLDELELDLLPIEDAIEEVIDEPDPIGEDDNTASPSEGEEFDEPPNLDDLRDLLDDLQDELDEQEEMFDDDEWWDAIDTDDVDGLA